MQAQKQLRLLSPLIALAALPLAGYAYLGSLTRFMGDDYCSAYYAEKLGLFRSIWYWYITWSGRYTAFAFDWLVLIKTFGRYGAGLVPPLVLALWLILTAAGLHSALRGAAPQHRNFPAPVALAALLLFVVLGLSPDLPQSFYWLNGLRSYSLPLVMLTFNALLFEWSLPRLRSTAAVTGACLAALILAFAAGGLSETFAVFQVALLAFLIVVKISVSAEKRPALPVLAAGLAGAVVSVIVIVLAPGNALRQTFLPAPPGLLRLTTISMQAYLAFLVDLLTTPQRLAALAGALLAAAWIGAGYTGQIPFRPWLIPLLVIGGLALSFACFPPAVYGYSEPPPARTLIIPAFALTACLMAAAFLFGTLRAGLKLPALLLAGLLIGFASLVSLRSVYMQRGTYIAFAHKWDAADAQIVQARDGKQASVLIPAMDNPADVDPPNDNPKFWATECYSEYYGIAVIGPPN